MLKSEEYKKEISERIQSMYPQLKGKKNIVYCPTFRKNEKRMEEEINKLIDNVDYDKYNLIMKLHPLSKIKINDNRVICDNKFSSFEMLFVADYLISDYSCIIYEAAVLGIPLYFWSFDLQKYLDTRGLTFDYKKEVPGIVSDNIKEILKEIEKGDYNYKKLQEFRKKYVTNVRNCSEKIVEFIRKEILNKREKRG